MRLSVWQELVIALQRTGDPGGLSGLRPHLDVLAGLDPTAETDSAPDWILLLQALKVCLWGQLNFYF